MRNKIVKQAEVVSLMAEYFAQKESLKNLISFRNSYLEQSEGCSNENRCLHDEDGNWIKSPDPSALCPHCLEMNVVFKQRLVMSYKLRAILQKVKARVEKITKTEADVVEQ